MFSKVPSQMYLLINVQTDSDGRPTGGGDPQGVKEILDHLRLPEAFYDDHVTRLSTMTMTLIVDCRVSIG